VISIPLRRWWLPAAVGIAGLAVLYSGALRTGFLNDDYLFLEEARTRPLAAALQTLGPLGNYWRPVSRQLYFAALTPVAGGHPAVFHAANFALFLAALALLADLLAACVAWPGVLTGLTVFAVLPFQRVNLTWISCSQDLLALVFTLAAVALFRRRRDAAAVTCFAFAVFSKESALPLPAVLVAWAVVIERAPWRATLRRLAPFLAVAAVWAAIAAAWRVRVPASGHFLQFAPDHFVAGYVHFVQSVLGLEHPAGMPRALLRPRPDLAALVLLAPLALWLDRRPAAAAPNDDPTRPAPRAVLRFALLWIAAFGVVLGPVAAIWSAYYATLAAVGVALLAGLAGRRMSPPGWLVLLVAALTVHAATTSNRAFAARDDAWGWTSHLTSFYFQRVATLTDSMSVQLERLEPRPAHGTRFFFTTLPPWAGFQSGNGALIRALYRDSTLASYYYSQFSDSTAGFGPCRFYYWDGAAIAPYYDSRSLDPWFQVGSDLLVFGRLDGASHAFRRSLDAGEDRFDTLYWLGWTALFRGDRRSAEAAWTMAGMREDSTAWRAAMYEAQQALLVRNDTLAARRALARSLRYGPGRPDAHGVLGALLLQDRPKYALLELKVAIWLNPQDWVARRDLVTGLVGQRLDDLAWTELAALERVEPGARRDPVLAPALATLESRRRAGAVVEF
jgi:tetratricopeptide (TPR) repeat protein